MADILLRATPTEEPCPECDGTGEAEYPAAEPWWPCMSEWDCIECHGTGKVLKPIPLAKEPPRA